MNPQKQNNIKIACKHVSVLLLAFSAVATFAALGDGGKKKNKSSSSLLSNRNNYNNGSFSLKSGYSYRGSQVISPAAEKYIRLNTVVTTQKGNTTYVVPLKKKVILDNVKIELGNQQLKRN